MDQVQYEEVLNAPKDESVLGTYESSAFLLSLRDRNEFSRLHPSGYHCIPHIGTYGQEYTLALPMVLLSLPTTPSYLQKLPQDILNALDLEHCGVSTEGFVTSSTAQTPPNTPLRANTPVWIRTQDTRLQTVARQLVWTALLNACSRVLYEERMSGIVTQMDMMSTDSNWSIYQQNSSDCLESGSSVYLSTTTFSSKQVSPYDQSTGSSSKQVSFVNHSTGSSSMQVSPGSSSRPIDYTTKEYEQEVRIAAKKLVNKVLHLACNTVESMYRRSSIEYLIASTKRMKIAQSPSPPPTLYEETTKEVMNGGYWFQPGRTRRSPSPDYIRLKKLGAKRQRSGSHDIAMQCDVKEKRHFGTWRSQSDGTESRRILKVRSRVSSQLTNAVSQMSITEESDSASEDENLVISRIGERQQISSIVKASRAHEIAHVSSVQSMESHEMQAIPQMQRAPSINVIDQDDSLLDMDFFVVVHSSPTPTVCQKFLCGNMNEINLVFHCWLYRDSPFVSTLTLNNKVEMGVFSPYGVEPVHLDLQDAGVPFYLIDKRTVCIHSCCFSPENAQLQLVPTNPPLFHSFFSVAKHGSRRVVTFHLIPANQVVENTVRRALGDCSNVRQLLYSMKDISPEMGERLAYLVLPVSL